MKDLLPEIQRQNRANLKLLTDGINLYHQQKISSKLHGSVIWENGSTKLYQYSTRGQPILFIPSLINKPNILDLSEKHSLMLRLTKLGLQPLLLDWGAPQANEVHFTLDDYIERLVDILNLLGPISVAGYCMGGQLAIAAAYLKPKLVTKIITIATPWDFSSFKLSSQQSWINLIEQLPDPVPSSFIQLLFYQTFWSAVNRKFIALARDTNKINDFALIENWANDGIAMSKNVFQECFINLFMHNGLMRGLWQVGNQFIDAKSLTHPTLCVFANKDKVAPKESCIALHQQLKNSRSLEINSGHIGMIINDRYQLAQIIANYF